MKDSFFIRVYKTEHGVAYAIAMRADYRAEHQVGINDLLLSVGADPESVGLERYRVRPGKPDVVQVTEGYVYGWRTGRKSKLRATLLVGVPEEIGRDYIVEVADREKVLNATWSGKNFIVSARDKESSALLREIAVEANSGRVLVYQGMNPVEPTDGGCLMLVIENRAPVAVLEKIVELQKGDAA